MPTAVGHSYSLQASNDFTRANYFQNPNVVLIAGDGVRRISSLTPGGRRTMPKDWITEEDTVEEKHPRYMILSTTIHIYKIIGYM